jgi:hypothetical protein
MSYVCILSLAAFQMHVDCYAEHGTAWHVAIAWYAQEAASAAAQHTYKRLYSVVHLLVGMCLWCICTEVVCKAVVQYPRCVRYALKAPSCDKQAQAG